MFKIFCAQVILAKLSKRFLQTKKSLSNCSGVFALGPFQKNHQKDCFKLKSHYPFVQEFIRLGRFNKIIKLLFLRWKKFIHLSKISCAQAISTKHNSFICIYLLFTTVSIYFVGAFKRLQDAMKNPRLMTFIPETTENQLFMPQWKWIHCCAYLISLSSEF